MKPIEKIMEALNEANAVGLVGYKSMDYNRKDTLHLLNVNGEVIVLQDMNNERGSYQLFSCPGEGLSVQDDIDFIKSLT